MPQPNSPAPLVSSTPYLQRWRLAESFGAIRLQTKELELQRLEIEETRDELRRSADAQHQSQQMHFLAALLAARNNVAQGYAAAAARETGPLRPSHAAHQQHLAELEWLLHQIDRHEANPFGLPAKESLVAHQLSLLVDRTQPVLKSALANRASNHVRSLLLDFNQSLRELRRLLAVGVDSKSSLTAALDKTIVGIESVNAAANFDEIAQICQQSLDTLRRQLSISSGGLSTLPWTSGADDKDRVVQQ
jgi:hypothetical protein